MKQLGLDATFMDMSDPAKVREAHPPEHAARVARDAVEPDAQDLRHRRHRRRREEGGRSRSSSTTRSRRRCSSARSISARPSSSTRRRSTSTATPTSSAARSLTSDDALAEKLHFLQKSVGGVPSPFDCYMVLRGLKTLGVRMRQHVASAAVARRPASRGTSRSSASSTPASTAHPGHAHRGAADEGPRRMISFELAGRARPRRAAFLRRCASSPAPRASAASSRSPSTRRS